MSDPIESMNLGGYQVVGRLGRGAMADVYDAVDSTGHEVALKVFKAGGGMSYTMLERFRREAEATKVLRRHPYILTVYASGHEGDLHYIAMERIKDSRSLESFIHKKPARAEILKIVLKIAEALQYSHDHQIIHRDVKPANVLLDEFNEPMLSDFGVAELTDWPSLTLDGALTGTPLYMAPEQARGEVATPSSDVYSLAVVLYEALTGELPYELAEAAPTSAILDAVKHQAPRPPRTLESTISRDLQYVLLRALRKSPSERYTSAREFAADLESVLEGKPLAARWVSPWSRSRFWIRQHRTALAGVSALLFLGLVGWFQLRELLSRESYSRLILLAEKKSVELAGKSTGPVMQSARQAMSSGRWIEARDLLQSAMQMNRALGEEQPMYEAMHQLARAEIMLQNSQRGRELLQEVRGNGDLPDLFRQRAGFEELLLALLDQDREGGAQIRASLEGTPPGPYVYLMQVAMGEEPGVDLSAVAEGWRPLLRWNLVLAEAVRDRQGVPRDELEDRLRKLSAGAEDPQQWPLPFSRYIMGRL